MKVDAYIPAGYSVTTLAKADETDLGRMIAHAVKVEQARIRRAYTKRPKVNCEDVTDDIRYKLGQEAAVGFIVDLFRDAKTQAGGVVDEGTKDFPDDI